MTDPAAPRNLLLDRRVLDQTTWDSGLLSGLASIVHRLDSPGDFLLTILRDDQPVLRVPLSVVEPSSARPLAPKLDVDLRSPRGQVRRLATDLDAPVAASLSGYVTFNGMGERAGHLITLERSAAQPGEAPGREVPGREIPRPGIPGRGLPVRGIPGREVVSPPAPAERFDSRQLGSADVYAVTLLRPGVYAVTNLLTQATGMITVAYPTMGQTPYRPPAPLEITCSQTALDPADVQLQPAQGIIFRFQVPSRIKIELTQPIDRPDARMRRSSIATWRGTPGVP